jgi:hypothetical protein
MHGTFLANEEIYPTNCTGTVPVPTTVKLKLYLFSIRFAPSDYHGFTMFLLLVKIMCGRHLCMISVFFNTVHVADDYSINLNICLLDSAF